MNELFSDIKSVTDEAVDRGYEHAHELWKEYAIDCVEQVCLSKEEFTMDEVRDLVRNCPHKTHDLRAMGGIIKKAQKMKWCESTGEIRHSKNVIAHGTPIHVWKSLIFKKSI